MTYLLAMLWLPLFVAFSLGVVGGYGWRKRGEAMWASAIIRSIAALSVAAAVIAFTGLVSGRAGFWVETASVLGFAYVLGWSVASLSWVARAPVAQAERTEPVMPSAPISASSPLDEETFIAQPAEPVVGEAAGSGSRPDEYAAPQAGVADDLKLIKGIGKQIEVRLNGLGIWHFHQIAAWSQDNVDWVGAYLAFPGRIERENWVSQARVLADGGTTAFATRARTVKSGSSSQEAPPEPARVQKSVARKPKPRTV